MKLLRSLDDLSDGMRRGALTIGNFDGVHRGHARIMERLKHWSAKVAGPSTVLTFDPHPVRVLRPDVAPPPLTWTERKAELLGELGVDVVVACHTTPQLLALSYQDFFQQVIVGRFEAAAIVEGPNFFFGRDRLGNVELLAELCRDANIPFQVVEPLTGKGSLISSTRIREAIRNGEVDMARSMLTHPYRIRGLVVHGSGRGAPLGFPTANLDGVETLIPAMGVYAGQAMVSQSLHPAAIHIGPSPTFAEKGIKVEVHLLNFEEPLYGQILEVDFLSRLRGIQQFDSPSDLSEQLNRDVQRAASVFESAQPT